MNASRTAGNSGQRPLTGPAVPHPHSSAARDTQTAHRTGPADLHTHSTASDGQYTPTELVELAKQRGLAVLALTDHDTTDGCDEAVRAGERLGVRVIRGVELDAEEYHTFHILGYAYDPSAPSLEGLCGRMKEERDQRGERIARYLAERGMPVDLAEVRALAGTDGRLGRPHFARIMLSHGYVSSIREAFDRFLDTEEYHARVRRAKPSARECLDAIKAAGGKASLAHPYQIGIDDDALDALAGKLVSWGLDAIECWYPRFTPAQQAFYLSLTEKYHIHATGGSDFHGERVKPDIALAALDLDLDWLI